MSPARRRAWLAAAGAAAAAAGIGGYAWRALRRGDEQAAADFWSLRFDRPEGGTPIATAEWRGRPLVVNFWATWCAPCIKEMPELDRFRQWFVPRGGEVLGLAVDNAVPVLAFLQKLPVAFPIALAGFAGTDLSRRLGNAGGGLPFTVIFGRDGRIVARRVGQTHYAELVDWATPL
jgi:thiol-disulfide isomerase/thioredoxin